MNPRSTQTELNYLFSESGAASAICLDTQVSIIKALNKKNHNFLLIHTKIDDFEQIDEGKCEKNIDLIDNYCIPLFKNFVGWRL